MSSAGMPETRARNKRHSREALIRKDVWIAHSEEITRTWFNRIKTTLALSDSKRPFFHILLYRKCLSCNASAHLPAKSSKVQQECQVHCAIKEMYWQIFKWVYMSMKLLQFSRLRVSILLNGAKNVFKCVRVNLTSLI